MKRIYAAIISLSFFTVAFSNDFLIVAHKGAAKNAPENTIPAFILAWEEGADAIECDFRLSKDGYIICIHDESTGRISDKDIVVKESTLEELQKLDLGIAHGEKYKGTTIPTISEVFAIVPADKKIYLEIKCGVEIIPRLLEEIKKSTLHKEQIVIISFDKEVIREFKSQCPEIKALLLSGFRSKSGPRPSVEEVLEVVRQIKADGLSSNKSILSIDKNGIKKVIEQGYEYHIWTIDDVKHAILYRKLGAKSITTNVPGELRTKLNETENSNNK